MAYSLLDYAIESQNPSTLGLVKIITNEAVFPAMLRFMDCDLAGYKYSREQTLGGIAFRALNETFTDSTGVINPMVEIPGIFGGAIKTDRQIVESPGGVQRRNGRVAARVRKAALFFDAACINGDSVANPKSFDGLRRRLTGDQVLKQATNGGALTLDKLDEALDRVVGSNEQKTIICSKAVRRQISKLYRPAQGNEKDRFVASYEGATIKVIDEDGDESPIFQFNETCGSSSVTTSLYVVRFGGDADEEFVQGIKARPIEHIDDGQRGGMFYDLIEANLGIALFHPRSACRLMGLTA